MADCLENLEQIEQANLTDEQAIAMLSPYLVLEPSTFYGLMSSILRDYIRRCEKARHELNTQLLAPVLEILQKLRQVGS
jgi:hypothetical protein